MALTLSLYRRDKVETGHTLVVFIHGLGAPETTWISGDKTWKDLILTDNNLKGVDVAIVKYDTAHVALGLLNTLGIKNIKVGFFRKISVGKGPFTNIKILSQELKRELNTNRSKEYEKVIIVGHSMGGLIGIRYILEEIENNEKINVKGFISLATPYNGSNKAFYNSLIKSIHEHAQIAALEPNSVFLDDTIRLWQKHKDSTNIKFTFCFGTDDEWVSEESSIPHIVSSKWTDSIPLPGDHSSILNVENHESSSYVVVSESIQEIILERNKLYENRNQILKEQKVSEKNKQVLNRRDGDTTNYDTGNIVEFINSIDLNKKQILKNDNCNLFKPYSSKSENAVNDCSYSDHTSGIDDVNYVYKARICKDIKRLLIENHRVFVNYGPKSDIATKNPLSNAHEIWEQRKREKIVPNNDKIVKLIEDNKELFDVDEYEICCEFIEHANGFEKSCQSIMEDVKQFPIKFDEVISKYARI